MCDGDVKILRCGNKSVKIIYIYMCVCVFVCVCVCVKMQSRRRLRGVSGTDAVMYTSRREDEPGT